MYARTKTVVAQEWDYWMCLRMRLAARSVCWLGVGRIETKMYGMAGAGARCVGGTRSRGVEEGGVFKGAG